MSGHFFLLSHDLRQHCFLPLWGGSLLKKCEGSFSSPPSTLWGVGLEAASCTSLPCCGALPYSMHSFPRRPPSASDCPQGTRRSSCPSTLDWHRCFACAPCRVAPTRGWTRWWERRCPCSRLLCLSSYSAALKLPGKECTLFKDPSLAVFLWIL